MYNDYQNNNHQVSPENQACTNDNSANRCEPCAEVNAKTENMCEQVCINPNVIPSGDVFVKIPVLLAETSITIPVEATVTLDMNAVEIKRIKKNVFLTQCRLIPFSQDKHKCTGLLFISGFIRKNIEYATQTCESDNSRNICGDIRQCTVKVPFNCTTRVKFFREPFFCKNPNAQELEFFTDNLRSCDACADPVIGRDPCDQNFTSTEIFNEKPFCELVKACVTEIDIHKCPETSCENPTEQSFRKFTEKVVVDLTVKVLQKQQVRLDSLGKPEKSHEPCNKQCFEAPECPSCEQPMHHHQHQCPREKDC